MDTQPILHQLAREYANLNWEFFGNRLSPLPLMLSESTSRLGCYSRDPRGIQLSFALVLEQPWGAVIEVLKHEMAHQFVFEVLRHDDEASHGPSFQRVCERMGIDARASGLPEAGPPERSGILARIRKLFALAGSPNQHEAEAAMRMAHRLMLRHNLKHVLPESSTNAFSFRHLGKPTGRISEAESLLAAMLGEFFFVQPIWVSFFRIEDQKRVSMLEVTGRHENLAMAEYVYGFLLRTADSLWDAHKREHKLRSNADRRAFLAGVMRGFADKLRAERKAEAAEGLVWVSDPNADLYFRRRHPRVRNTTYSSSAHSQAGAHGQAAGRDIVLQRPIGEGPGKKVRALPG